MSYKELQTQRALPDAIEIILDGDKKYVYLLTLTAVPGRLINYEDERAVLIPGEPDSRLATLMHSLKPAETDNSSLLQGHAAGSES